jgi:hypothetical protein
MQAETHKFKEWLSAEKEAQAAERELYAVMLQFGQGTSALPLDERVQSARMLRARAHSLFDQAMQEMKDLTASLHHRRILPAAATRVPSRSGPREDGSDSGAPSAPVQR